MDRREQLPKVVLRLLLLGCLASPSSADDLTSCFAGTGRDAVVACTKAIEGQSKLARLYFQRGLAWSSIGMRQLADDDMSAAISLKRDEYGYYKARCLNRITFGRHSQALEDCDRAVYLNRFDLTSRNNRAWALVQLRRPREGLEDIEIALEAEPDNWAFLDTRGHIFEAVGEREKAIADFRRVLSIKPDTRESIEALARLGASP